MAQFDLYWLHEIATLVVDLQSGAVDGYNTRLVAPLVPIEPNLKPLRRVNREFTFNSQTYLFMPQLMSSIRTRDLGDNIGSLADQRDQITSALDMLFLGI